MTQKVPQKNDKIKNDKIKKRQKIIEKTVESLQNDFGLFNSNIQEINQDSRQLSKLFDKERNFFNLQGRAEECKVIQEFVHKLIFSEKKLEAQKQQETKNVLLIEGMAGIGKTLCIRHFQHAGLQKLGSNKRIVKFVYVNAKKLKYPQQIYKVILSRLNNSRGDYSSKISQQILQQYLKHGLSRYVQLNRGTLIFLVIDEVESLQDVQDELDTNILSKLLVYWPREKYSNFSVILVTNDLNLLRKLPKKIVNKVKWAKLTLSPYQPIQLQRIIKQRLQQGQHTNIFENETIQLFCQQFAKRQTNIRKFLYVLKETIRRNIDQRRSENFLGNYSYKYSVQSIPSQKVMEVLMQKCKNATFSDDFKEFPKPYKIVLASIAEYLQRFTSNPQSFKIISFEAMYQTLRKVLIRGKEQFRNILYDLQDLKLLKIQYRKKKEEPATINSELINRSIEMDIDGQIDKDTQIHFLPDVEIEIILLKIGVQQILTAINKDQSLDYLLGIDFQYPQTGILL